MNLSFNMKVQIQAQKCQCTVIKKPCQPALATTMPAQCQQWAAIATTMPAYCSETERDASSSLHNATFKKIESIRLKLACFALPLCQHIQLFFALCLRIGIMPVHCQCIAYRRASTARPEAGRRRFSFSVGLQICMI